MAHKKLYFDVRDLFRAPRLALSGKKIWILLEANLIGYLIYWVSSYVSLAISGYSFGDMWTKYGLYPCLMGNEANWIAYVIWGIGCLTWIIAIVLGYTAVSRVTYKQLKGDEFYSSKDAWKFTKKHWHAPVFTSLSILLIVFFFVVMAVVFALIGKIPFLGELFFGIPYLLWFAGSIFVAYTMIVLCISGQFTPAIVGTMEEDTMGSVFQNYTITWSQPWRILLYVPIICTLMVIGVKIFSLFMKGGYYLINIVFGHSALMGDKLSNMVGWATNVVFGSNSPLALCCGSGSCLSNAPAVVSDLGTFEMIGAFFVAVSIFLIFGTVISYFLSIEAVGITLAFLILIKKSDDENLLERKDEDELEEDEELENEMNEVEQPEVESSEDKTEVGEDENSEESDNN